MLYRLSTESLSDFAKNHLSDGGTHLLSIDTLEVGVSEISFKRQQEYDKDVCYLHY